MTDHPGLSIVVPVYRGANTVGQLVAELSALKPEGGMEIILVNDGSPDNSAEVCQALLGTATVPLIYIEHARNYGEHNAVMTGLRRARGDYVITMDDDLQNPPEEVVRLFDFASRNKRDVVYTYYATKQHAAWRNLGSRFTNWCSDILLDKPKGLYLSSFRCVSAFVVQHVIANSGPYPYVDGLILQVTQDVDRLQVSHLPRAEGRSNYTLRRLVRLWLSMFLNFSVFPLRVATLSGIAVSVIGLLASLYIVYDALSGGSPRGYPSLMAAVLVLAGVQLIMLGIIGEYLGRMFITTNARPQYIVREVLHRAEAKTAADNQPSPT